MSLLPCLYVKTAEKFNNSDSYGHYPTQNWLILLTLSRCFKFNFVSPSDSSPSPGEFELELLSSFTVKETNHNPLMKNAMNTQGTCQHFNTNKEIVLK